jgi:hypothetical protein
MTTNNPVPKIIIWSSSSSYSQYQSNNCNCKRTYACVQQVCKHTCTDSMDKMLLNTEVQAGLHVKFSLKLSSVWGVIINFPEWLYCKYSCILRAKWEGSLTAVTWNHYTLGHPCWHCWELFLQIKVSVPTTFLWTFSMSWHLQTLQGELQYWKEKKKSLKAKSREWKLGGGVFQSNNLFFLMSCLTECSVTWSVGMADEKLLGQSSGPSTHNFT